MKLTPEQTDFINALLVAGVKSFHIENVDGVMTVNVKGPIDVATFMENVYTSEQDRRLD